MPAKKKNPAPDRDIWEGATTHDRWLDIVMKALIHSHPPAQLRQLYELIEPHPKTTGRKHWKAKVRQVLERSDAFVRVAPGTWDLSSQHPAKALEEFKRQRRERYPERTEANG